MRALPSAERVRELFAYDPATGIFRWKKTKHSHRIGTIAGTVTHYGYRVLQIDGQQYAAHRIAWVHFHGRPPAHQIDHKSLDRDDNRIENLREATHAENNMNKGPNKNNSHGFKGVTFTKGRWRAQVKKDYRNHYAGSFRTAEEANAAYLAKARELFGDFARAS